MITKFDRDLRRDGLYSLHCGVDDQDGGQGEFFVRGQARRSDDPGLWVIADKYVPYPDREDDFVLFELNIDTAFGRVYAQYEAEKTLALENGLRINQAELPGRQRYGIILGTSFSG